MQPGTSRTVPGQHPLALGLAGAVIRCVTAAATQANECLYDREAFAFGGDEHGKFKPSEPYTLRFCVFKGGCVGQGGAVVRVSREISILTACSPVVFGVDT